MNLLKKITIFLFSILLLIGYPQPASNKIIKKEICSSVMVIENPGDRVFFFAEPETKEILKERLESNTNPNFFVLGIICEEHDYFPVIENIFKKDKKDKDNNKKKPMSSKIII